MRKTGDGEMTLRERMKRRMGEATTKMKLGDFKFLLQFAVGQNVVRAVNFTIGGVGNNSSLCDVSLLQAVAVIGGLWSFSFINTEKKHQVSVLSSVF